MKKWILSALVFCCTIQAQAQTENWCGTDAHNEAIQLANPGMADAMHEHLLRVTSGAYTTGDREDFIIPVVVHVLHNNGAGNISFEQIQSGIDMLNEDFNRTNEDAINTRDTDEAPFAPNAVSMGIRFELAKIDPDGNCTNGVQRRFVGAASFNANDAAKHYSTGGLDAWNRNYYFNIWVVNSISSGGAGTTLGYAEFPYGGGSSNYGVIIRNDVYGRIGTAGGDRTLTHEVGHCLGLLHTFQNGCHLGSCDAQGDYCCDTPPVSDPQWSCSDEQNTCIGVPSGDPYDFDAFDQYENYMSYSPCQNMYSEDQKNIVLGNLASIGFLENLVNPENYDLTGVGSPAVLCKAQFMSENPVVCAGTSVAFYDESYANVTGWTWTFEGGSPATSTEENPVVTYDLPGEYNVTLTVTDGASIETTTQEGYVTVLSNPGMSLPFVEGFETIDVPDNDRFLVINEDDDANWQVTDAASFSGSKCVYLNNYGVDNNSLDELISGTIDLSGVDPDDDIVFNFKFAYEKRYPSNDEWLRFFISKDCGQTWALRKNIDDDDLSETNTGASYVPTSKEEWTQVNITNINADYYSADFRFKLQFKNNTGNNIYIDDINLYPASTASTAAENTFTFNVYPNPADDVVNLAYNASSSPLTVRVTDMLGKAIMQPLTLAAGSNATPLSFSTLVPGIYFITATDDTGFSTTIRFVKQ